MKHPLIQFGVFYSLKLATTKSKSSELNLLI